MKERMEFWHNKLWGEIHGREPWISNSSVVMEKGLAVEVLKRKPAIPLGEINPNGTQDKRLKLMTEEVSWDQIKQIIGLVEVAQQPR